MCHTFIKSLILILSILTVEILCDGDINGTSFKTKVVKPSIRAKSTTEQEWIETSLERHNYYRSLHNCQKLVINDTLSEISQAWSNYLLDRAIESITEKKNNTLEIFFDHNYEVLRKYRIGENLYYMWNDHDKLNASLAVLRWYEEIKDYDFRTSQVKATSLPQSQIGHFTALVWNATTQMGSAYASKTFADGTTLTFVTANYFPGGNIQRGGMGNKYSLYFENVVPPISEDENEIIDNGQVIKKLVLKYDVPMAKHLTTPTNWIDTGVEKHNELRYNHYFPALSKSQELCQVAQEWANYLLSQGIPSFNQESAIFYLKNNYKAVVKGKFGENIMYFIGNEIIDPTLPINLWYQEKRFYDFDRRETNKNISKTARTDNFEQVIWKSTTHVGIAFATGELESGQLLTFIVANYYPSGPIQNIPNGRKGMQEKLENVPSNGSWMIPSNRNTYFITGLIVIFKLLLLFISL